VTITPHQLLARRIILTGLFIALMSVGIEGVAVRPERFPEWYPYWFWEPATFAVAAVAAVGIVRPRPNVLYAAAAAGAVWCFARGVFMLFSRPLPFPGVVAASVWVGFGMTMIGLGYGAAATSAMESSIQADE